LRAAFPSELERITAYNFLSKVEQQLVMGSGMI